MKKLFLPLIVCFTAIAFMTSCKKEGAADPLVPPGPSVQHPDSTFVRVTVPATAANIVKMVGDMKGDWPVGWQPSSDVNSLVLDRIDATTFGKLVAVTWFVKNEFEFKFVNGNDWNKEELDAAGAAVPNRKFKKADMKGKTVKFTVVRFK